VTAAHLVALDDQILAVLREEDVILSTSEIALQIGRRPTDPAVYRRLNRLERRGRVRKIRLRGWRAVYWVANRIEDVPTGGRL
jgi:Fe2+ or Zn2+ uptake regulation protein